MREGETNSSSVWINLHKGLPNMVETYKLKPLVASKGEKKSLLSIREKSALEPQTVTRNSPDLPEILPDPEREIGAPSLMQPSGASCEAQGGEGEASTRRSEAPAVRELPHRQEQVEAHHLNPHSCSVRSRIANLASAEICIHGLEQAE